MAAVNVVRRVVMAYVIASVAMMNTSGSMQHFRISERQQRSINALCTCGCRFMTMKSCDPGNKS
jgi:hypothetical protein